MEEAGILHPEEKVELIDGEITTMAAKTPRHDDMLALIGERLADQRNNQFRLAYDSAFRLSEYQEPEPDIILLPSDMLASQVRGHSALLVIEVAVTSLSFDLNVKARIYAAHGVREYWVVDAQRLITHVHRDPGPDGYASVRSFAANDRLVSYLLPSVTLRISDLGLEPLEQGGQD